MFEKAVLEFLKLLGTDPEAKETSGIKKEEEQESSFEKVPEYFRLEDHVFAHTDV